MRWCFQNATHLYADSVPRQLALGAAIVPVLWRYEVSAVLVKSLRDGYLTARRADELLATSSQLNITVDPNSSDHILTDVHNLAVAHRLTSYDASYLELALRKSIPLATLDNELIAAARSSGVVLF